MVGLITNHYTAKAFFFLAISIRELGISPAKVMHIEKKLIER